MRYIREDFKPEREYPIESDPMTGHSPLEIGSGRGYCKAYPV